MEEKHYTVSLNDRRELRIDGVCEVISFQERQAEAETQLGTIQITGEGLHLEHLDLDAGEMVVTGRVDSLYYPEDATEERKGFFSRLFS